MENPLPNNPANSPSTSSALKPKPPQASTLPEFLAAGGNAEAFLRKLRKSAFLIPSSETVRQMAQGLVALPNGAPRVLTLLQALDEDGGSIRESILRITEEYLRQRNALPDVLPPANCGAVAERLMRPAAAKGPKPKFELSGIYLLLAFHRGWLAEDDMFPLLVRAFPVPKQKRSRSGEAKVEPSAMRIILSSPLRKPGLPVLLALHAVWQRRTVVAEERIFQFESTVARLESENAQLTEELRAVRAEIAALNSTVCENDARIAALAEELSDTRSAAKHRHDALKGRVRGFLEGELSRWLQNASEAANVEPVRVRVIQERLQSALGKIQKEAQWLQSSD